MEEDGAVVYFEGSPGALQVGGMEEVEEELVLKEERGVFIERLVYQTGGGRSWAGLAWRWFGSKSPWLAKERHHLMKITHEIRNSSLLTDEDLQLIESATYDSTHKLTHPFSNHTHSQGVGDHTHWSLIKYISLFPVVIAIGWWLHPLIAVVGVAFLLPFLVCRLSLDWLDHVMSCAQVARQDYRLSMDRMLTQLTTTIRWLQEMEVVSRGLTRPFSTGTSGWGQCHAHIHLRQRVLHTCTAVLGELRTLTREVYLSRDVRIEPELEDRKGYLAFRKLQDLHQFMSEDDTGNAEVSKGEEQDILSLESIKDCCSLLAVQNSELLRSIFLTASAALATPTFDPFLRMWWALCVWSRQEVSMVAKLSQHLAGLRPLLEDKVQQLDWSLNYHKNMLLGAPPTRSTSSLEVTRMNPDLLPLMEEIHCMDLKTQCLLQRVRDMGVSLVSPGNLPPVRDLLRSHLSAIQTDLRGVTDLVESAATLIHGDEGAELTTTLTGSRCGSVSDDGDSASGATPTSDGGSDCSEEQVFEGYVCEDDLNDGCGQWEGLEDAEMGSEVPAPVLTELKNVLTVRNHKRERKRRLRHGNAEVSHDQPSASESHDQKGVEQEVPVSHDRHRSSVDGDKWEPTSHDQLNTDHKPHDQTDHSPLQISAEIATAIRARTKKNSEDIFS